jgi:hypothetical protein
MMDHFVRSRRDNYRAIQYVLLPAVSQMLNIRSDAKVELTGRLSVPDH